MKPVIVIGDADRVLDSLKRALHSEAIDLIIEMVQRGLEPQIIERVRKLRAQDESVPILLVVEQSSEDLAIAAFRAGVTDYFRQPVHLESLLAAVKRYLHIGAAPPAESRMIGDGFAMRQIKASLDRVAASGSNVLITGETGTGKELIADLIHRRSSRSSKPMVCINCAAIPEGLLESELFGYERGAFTGAQAAFEGKLNFANKGTVFFDEIGDMSLYAQAKVLRAIENKEIYRLGGKTRIPLDIRVVAATNRDLETMAREDRFRRDLFFRLNVVQVSLPPLRKRKEDIPALLAHYLGQFNTQFRRDVGGFSDQAMDCLLRYDWPGNVRELKNLIEAVFITLSSNRVDYADLPLQFREHLQNSQSDSAERDRLIAALLETNWNKSRTAEKLQWSRMTLYRKMAKYNINSSR